MENLRKILVSVVLVMIVMSLQQQADSALHRVGGGQFTWRPDVNFSEWASHEHFYTGDWLFFGFDKTKYNVLQVNETSYDKCVEEDFIANITRGGRDVFNLTEPKLYYFICGRGYCFKGMKVAIPVHDAAISPSQALPLSSISSSSKAVASTTFTFALLISSLLFASLF